jgi:TonB family protein
MSSFQFRATVLVLALGLLSLPAAAQNTPSSTNAVSPAKVDRIDPQFPPSIQRLGRSVGPLRTVKLEITVLPDGRAGDVTLAMTSGFDLYDKAAVEAARNATYTPAMNNGMAVESRLAYDVSFGLLCNRAAGNVTCDYGRFPTTCSATVCQTLVR